MNDRTACTRRSALKLGAGTLATASLSPLMQADEPAKGKGHIKQSVCRWCYSGVPLEKLAEAAKRIGYQSIELISPDEYKVVKKFGLTCAVMRCASGIKNGLNRTENHD